MIRFFAGLFLVVASAPAWSQSDQGEQIAQAPLDGFVVGNRREGGGNLIVEQVPRGESVTAWTRMVTVQRFVGVSARTSAAAFLENIRSNLLPQSCPGATTTRPASMTVSGRRASRMRADCPLNPSTGLPETFVILAIEGPSAMHVAQAAFRRVPSPQDISWAERQLGTVVLCERGSREAVCTSR